MSIVRKEPLKSKENVVRITKEEAIELQWKSIFEWKPPSDVWPFRYGISALGVGAALSSLVVISHYRRNLKLKHHARIAMNAPVVALPSIILPLLHQKLVSEPILVQSVCPVCIQLRAILIQNAVGVMYPMILAPLTGFMYSTVFLTYPLPLLTMKNIPELYSIWRKMTLPFRKKLTILLAINTVLAAAITEFEAKSFYEIQEKLVSNIKK